MSTYSLSITGASINQKFAVKELTVDDASAGTAGLQASAMQTGLSFLCKGADGGQRLYQIDPERSLPGGPFFLKRV